MDFWTFQISQSTSALQKEIVFFRCLCIIYLSTSDSLQIFDQLFSHILLSTCYILKWNVLNNWMCCKKMVFLNGLFWWKWQYALSLLETHILTLILTATMVTPASKPAPLWGIWCHPHVRLQVFSQQQTSSILQAFHLPAAPAHSCQHPCPQPPSHSAIPTQPLIPPPSHDTELYHAHLEL